MRASQQNLWALELLWISLSLWMPWHHYCLCSWGHILSHSRREDLGCWCGLHIGIFSPGRQAPMKQLFSAVVAGPVRNPATWDCRCPPAVALWEWPPSQGVHLCLKHTNQAENYNSCAQWSPKSAQRNLPGIITKAPRRGVFGMG